MTERQNEIKPITEINSYQERILLMRSERPKDWQMLSPSTRMAALTYEAGRREFERLKEINQPAQAA